MEKVIYVVDTETTGLQGPPNGEIVEVGITRLTALFDDFDQSLTGVRMGATKSWLCNPEMEINVNAMAVHHITHEMVEGAMPASELRANVENMKADYWCAHNVAFDGKFLKPKHGRWICSLKAAKVMYPAAPAHKNMVLRYHLGLDKMMDPQRVQNDQTHRAGFDSYVTACLLATMIYRNEMTLDEMADLFDPKSVTNEDVVPFGKYQGKPWSQVPRSYLSWMTKNMDNPELVAKAKEHLNG